MKIALIGMSGSGKSFWSKKLEEEGFERICCDDLIEERLDKELKKYGYSGIGDVAKWMGQPFDPQYSQTSAQYLQLEKEIMKEILDKAAKSTAEKHLVIDTTGSVIYTGKGILSTLANQTRIIYLTTPISVQEEMYRLYLSDPKPVIWGKSFKKNIGQSSREALAASYPKLLAFRVKEYEKLANTSLSYHRLRDKDYSIRDFMGVIHAW